MPRYREPDDLPSSAPERILPSRIGRRAQTYGPLLEKSYSSYSEWLGKQAGMTFFPEYTDHGVKHLSRVAQLADFLICDADLGRPSSWEVVSEADSLVLAGAILYHDMGMFLMRAAFAALLEQVERQPIETKWDLPWSVLWDTYVEESRHWEERTIRRLFGELPWSHRQSTEHLAKILRNDENLTKCQTLLIGEFIRRHHPRLAHEFACWGWPADDGPALQLNTSAAVAPDLRDLIGLVARSHGMQLRDTFGYLSRHHSNNLRESRGVHAVYLMTLLRIADVLHVHAERAPGKHAAIQKLASPYSRREWESHQAIYDIRLDLDEDPEAICIDVQPKAIHSAATLFRLREWHEMLQEELDQSWSVLGEVYGRYSPLSGLWLSLRRVKSNLNEPEFESQLSFVPCRAAFDTARGEYLKLLVQPLYGDNPGVGVRELLQNALDAVRERRALASAAKTTVAPIDLRFPDAEVVLGACSRDESTPPFEQGGPPADWLHWFESVDRGSGMTPEIVRDYFLKAGATYRRSSDWQKLFTDEHGHSMVLRTGRFGVGAVAAFLLGDQLQVITRHHSDRVAIAFVSRLEDELVEFSRATRQIGTTVRVRLSAPIANDWRFNWDWYHLSDPVVVRHIDGKIIDSSSIQSAEDPLFPSERADLPPAWRRIAYPPFTDIQWTYEKYGTTLTCNGISVSRERDDVKTKWHVLPTNGTNVLGHTKSTERSLSLKIPSISVFDPDGALPLTLTRERLATETYPFSEPLLESVIRDMLAYALVYGPMRRLTGDSHAYYRKLRYPGYSHGKARIEAAQWASLARGFTLAQIAMLRWVGVNRCIVLVSRKTGRALPNVTTDDAMALIAVRTDLEPEFQDSFWPLDNHFPRLWVPQNDQSPFPDEANWIGARALIRDNVKAFLESRSAQFKARKEDHSLDDELGELTYRLPEPERTTRPQVTSLLDGKFFLIQSTKANLASDKSVLPECAEWYKQKRARIENAGIVCEWMLDPDGKSCENAVVALWRKILKQPLIPYRMNDRRTELSGAFHELATEVAAWERLKTIDETEKARARSSRPQGKYPHFLNQQEIKSYLRESNVTRLVRVSKARDWWTGAADKVVFQVYVPYSRDELVAINPATPRRGNPFKGVEHDKDLLPEFRLIRRLLQGSNAAHPTMLGPPRE